MLLFLTLVSYFVQSNNNNGSTSSEEQPDGSDVSSGAPRDLAYECACVGSEEGSSRQESETQEGMYLTVVTIVCFASESFVFSSKSCNESQTAENELIPSF